MHRVWQSKGRLPTEILALPKGELAFVFASERVAIEESKPLATH